MVTMGEPVTRVDVVVVGSGPGGATVARQLACAGRRVVLLERGKDRRTSRLYGTYPGAMTYADRHALLFTRERMSVIRPLMLGGATSMYCGCAARPPGWLAGRYTIDLDPYVDETISELRVAPLPEELRGSASTRIAQAAGELGIPFEPTPKLVQPERSSRFDCGATCMLGCRCRAKWNAAEWVDEAVSAGCELREKARVSEVIVEDGVARGVRGRLGERPFEVRSETVVLAAGGIGTPLLLRRAGLDGAGRGIAMDTTTIVYGTARGRGNGTEPPMTYSWADEEARVMLSTLVDPWLLYPVINALAGLRYPLTWPRWGRTLGVMVKLRDELSGSVESERAITKPLTASDKRRLDGGIELSKRILAAAGADPFSVFVSPLRGTHPSATARIGDLLDRDLQTEIAGLYVCDASAFPEALGRPTVLTIIGLAKRLSEHLAPKVRRNPP
jgi:choline dehydrogenase-like flavoprotein